MSPEAPLPAAPPPARAGRIGVVDWLRGLAVVLMIQAHGFDAWLAPWARTGPGYELIKHLSGLPSRLFLLLVGVSAAIRFEHQVARRVDAATMRRQMAARGLAIIALAYLFRIQEYALAGFRGGFQQIFRIDILNAIGASMLVLAAIAVPRGGRRALVPALVGAVFFLGLGPLVGPAEFPGWLPRPLTSYIGGQRPMSWFPIFPWAAWALVGVAIGHLWIWAAPDPRRQRACFLAGGAIGLAFTLSVIAVREIAPSVIRYPSDLVQQMGPGSFFFRLGLIGAIAALGWMVDRWNRDRFSIMRQLGRTSLLVYWIHVDLCYGHLAEPLKRKLGIPAATVWVLLLVAAMLGISLLKTRYGRRAGAWLVARFRRA